MLREFRFAGVALHFLLAVPVFAQLPAARLLNISPAGGRAGETLHLTVSGADLNDLTDLRFSNPGITSTTKTTNRFEVTIATNVPPGIHDVRVIGKYGASNPRAFAVGLLPETVEGENTADQPQAVPLGTTINGRTEPNTVDYFRFPAKKGQRVIALCETRSINSKLEPVLVLNDSNGREVTRARSGGLLDVSPTEDSEFTLRLHDATYRGGADFFYRLSIGAFPHVDYVMPVDGGGDKRTKFAFYGHNFPGSKIADLITKPALERIEVELDRNDARLREPLTMMPAQAGLDLFEHRLYSEHSLSAPVLIRFPLAPVVTEDEPNQSPETARKITPPCEVAGQFHPNGDRDWFTFDTKKGTVFWIEVISHRLGLPTDPFVLVQYVGPKGTTDVLEMNDSGANVGGVEFNTSHRDPSGKFEAKEDGTYRVLLRDLFTQPRLNPALVYHLSIRQALPDFRLIALPATPLPAKKDAKDVAVATPVLRRGEVLPIKVIALRQDGFDGAIDVSAHELPPGVSSYAGRIEAGKNSTLVFLRATEDCQGSYAAIRIQGRAYDGATNQTRDAKAVSLTWSVVDPATESVQTHRNAEFIVSTVEESFPARLSAGEGMTNEVFAGGKLKVPLVVKADGELTGNWKLKAVGVAGLESAKEFDLNPKSTNAVYEIDLSQQKLEPGTYTFALQSLASVKPIKGDKKAAKESTFTLYSAPITFQVRTASTNSPAK